MLFLYFIPNNFYSISLHIYAHPVLKILLQPTFYFVFIHYSDEEEEVETTTKASTTTSTVMAPLLADEIYQKIWGSSTTTPRPGFGGNTLTFMADVSDGAIFHSCARMQTFRRRRRALPLIIGGLMSLVIASIAGQQTALDNYVNPTCPDGFIQFAHRCIKNQPEKCPRGFINIEIFNSTINE